jgi:GNAT superfamily N-acetyltransferase
MPGLEWEALPGAAYESSAPHATSARRADDEDSIQFEGVAQPVASAPLFVHATRQAAGDCMSDARLRPVGDADWPALLELANHSVVHVPGAGSQEAWHENRRQFDTATGVQRQLVAEDRHTGALLGYLAVESNLPGEFRLFLVIPSSRLFALGELLYARAVELLRALGARRVWFTEYAGDEPLLAFIRARGFTESRRFVLPEGPEAVTLVKDLPRRGAAGRTRDIS